MAAPTKQDLEIALKNLASTAAIKADAELTHANSGTALQTANDNYQAAAQALVTLMEQAMPVYGLAAVQGVVNSLPTT
jgi:hypothetical protein